MQKACIQPCVLIYSFIIILLSNLAFAQPIPQLPQIMSVLDTEHEVYLGQGVLGIGDVNNDFYDDVAVGYRDKTAIWYGGNPPDTQADVWISHGWPIAVGNLDGTGRDDILLFKPSFLHAKDSLFILLQNAEFDTIPDIIITGDTTIVRSYNFGQAIHIGGDFNHDGQGDLVITDNDADTHNPGTGKVYIYFGGDSLDSKVDFTITGEDSIMGLGWDVSAGDLNSDTFDDLVISGYNQLGPDSIATHYIDIYLGRMGQDFTQRDFRISKSASPHFLSLGAYLTVFDYNADGYEDIITGNGYIFWGGAPLDTTVDVFLDNPFYNHWTNKSANVGDINNDGWDDLGIGLPKRSLGAGYAIFYLGGPNANTGLTPDAARGPRASAGFGFYLNRAGDVNNDGVQDVIIGAPAESNGATAFMICSGDSTLSPLTGIESETVYRYGNLQLEAYPNPFNSTATLQFSLQKTSGVEITIFDILGRKVEKFSKKQYIPGTHKVAWTTDATVKSGVYFAQIATNSAVEVTKLLLIK